MSFIHTRAVYFHYGCAMFECDGPNFMFVVVFWYVSGFGCMLIRVLLLHVLHVWEIHVLVLKHACFV